MSRDAGGGNNPREGDAVGEELKSILIIGEQVILSRDLDDLYHTGGHLLIGTSKNEMLEDLDLEPIKYISKAHRIDIIAHASAKGGIHKLYGKPTKDFLKKIASYNKEMPLEVHLHSCYAGAAAADVAELPLDSVLIAHASEDNASSMVINQRIIFKSDNVARFEDPIQEFIHRFAINVKQGTTISIKKRNGPVFRYAIYHAHAQHVIHDPDEAARYLEYERLKFIQAYNMEFGNKIEIDKLPPITAKEAIEWRNDNFISRCIAKKGVALIPELNANPANFSEFINYSIQGDTALMTAVWKGNIELVKALLAVPKIDVNKALIMAAGNIELITLLLSAGSDVSEALVMSIEKDMFDLTRIIINSGNADVNARDKQGRTALALAADKGNIDLVKSLLDAGCKDINTALTAAIDKDNIELVTILVAVDGSDASAALLHATKGDKVDLVKTILSFGRDVNAKDALVSAVSKGNTELVDVLLAAKDIDASTALMEAVDQNRTGLIKTIIDSGKFNVNTQNEYGETALSMALGKGNDSVIEALIAIPTIDVLSSTSAARKQTLMFWAIKKGKPDLATTIIKSGEVDINAKDENNRTALMWAVQKNNAQVVSAFLSMPGIDVSGAYELAVKKNDENIMSIFKQHGYSKARNIGGPRGGGIVK